MEGSFKSRDNVLPSVHHLEGAHGLLAENLANHTNIALLGPMEIFEPLTHNLFRGGGGGCFCVFEQNYE